jgi:hypothetical protein
MPPNTRKEVAAKREAVTTNTHPDYWRDTPYAEEVHFEDEFKKLILEEVPVHAFRVGTHKLAEKPFPLIASRSEGVSEDLDVDSPAGAATLRRLVTERVLNDVVGGGEAGEQLLRRYREILENSLQATG